MENSLPSNHILRALGLDVRYPRGREDPAPRRRGPRRCTVSDAVHSVNIVTLPDPGRAAAGFVRYALDAGFGGDGPTLPMPLVDGLVHAQQHRHLQEIRLVRDLIPVQRWRSADAPLMVVQYRNGPEKEGTVSMPSTRSSSLRLTSA